MRSDCSSSPSSSCSSEDSNNNATSTISIDHSMELPPWKRELLLRRSALARAVEPNLSVVCRRLQRDPTPRRPTLKSFFFGSSSKDGATKQEGNSSLRSPGSARHLSASLSTGTHTRTPDPVGLSLGHHHHPSTSSSSPSYDDSPPSPPCLSAATMTTTTATPSASAIRAPSSVFQRRARERAIPANTDTDTDGEKEWKEEEEEEEGKRRSGSGGGGRRTRRESAVNININKEKKNSQGYDDDDDGGRREEEDLVTYEFNDECGFVNVDSDGAAPSSASADASIAPPTVTVTVTSIGGSPEDPAVPASHPVSKEDKLPDRQHVGVDVGVAPPVHGHVHRGSSDPSARRGYNHNHNGGPSVEWATFQWDDDTGHRPDRVKNQASAKQGSVESRGGVIHTSSSRVQSRPKIEGKLTTPMLGRERRSAASSSNMAVAGSSSSSSQTSSVTEEEMVNSRVARLYRSRGVTRKPAAYAGTGTGSSRTTVPHLDSDGTLGSGGDSDSSEEIHYGPGFVSRLKSRYMSVALRSSTRGSTATILRRTASLEDFLEKEKEEKRIEIRESGAKAQQVAKVQGHQSRHRDLTDASTSPHKTNKPTSTSVAARAVAKAAATTRRDSIKRAQSVEVLSISEQASSPSSSEQSSPTRQQKLPMRYVFEPPPTHTGRDVPPPLPPKGSSIDKVVNSLANEVAIVEKPKKKPTTSTSGVAQQAPLAKAIESTSSRRPPYKRRSSSLLFAVEDRELPAPDTVKETRKIFESRSTSRVPVPSQIGLGTKSKSSSSLYTSRSRSVDGRLARQNSNENLGHHRYRHHYHAVAAVAPQPSPRQSAVGGAVKPTLPNKPAHLTPTRASTGSNLSSPTTNYTPAPFKRKSEAAGDASPTVVSSFVMPPLRHVRGAGEVDEVSSTSSSSSDDRARKDRRARMTKELFDDDDEGIKVVSSAAISRIRQDGSSVSFNFKDAAHSGSHHRSYLSSKPGGSVLEKERQVGIIRPITREVKDEKQDKRGVKVELERPKEVIYLEKTNKATKPWMGVAEANKKNAAPANYVRNHVIKAEAVEIKHERPSKPEPKIAETKKAEKEVLVVAKKDKPASPKMLRRQEKVEKDEDTIVIKSNRSVKPMEETPKAMERIGADGDGDAKKTSSNAANGNYRDSWKKRNEEKNTMVFNFVNTEKEVSHIENDGRDISRRGGTSGKAKKKRNRTLAKEPGVILLNGGVTFPSASTDGADCRNGDDESASPLSSSSDSEDSEIDHYRPVSPCNVTFVGANVDTGKSSLRSKPKAKKMTLTFSQSLTEIYEYPSFETAVDSNGHDAPPSAIKSSSAMGLNSGGGLGSYTPSKIQMTEKPFQLGVSRATANTSNNTSSNGDAAAAANKDSGGENGVSWSGSSTSSDLLF